MTDEARKSLCLILDNLVNLDNLCNNLYNLDNLYNLVNLDNLCNNMYNLDNLHNLNNLNNMCECFNHATVSYVVRQLLGVKDHGLGPGPVQHRGPQPGHHQDHPVLLAVPVNGEGLPDRHVRLQAPTPLPRPPAPDMAPFFLKQYVRSHASNVFEAYPKLLTEMALMRRSQRLVKNPALTSTRPGFTCYASS